MTDIDLDDRISEMLAECELALRGKSYGGWCEVRYPARDIARLIRMLKRRTEALERLASKTDKTTPDQDWGGLYMATDTGNADDAYEQGAENADIATANTARAALAYQGEPDA